MQPIDAQVTVAAEAMPTVQIRLTRDLLHDTVRALRSANRHAHHTEPCSDAQVAQAARLDQFYVSLDQWLLQTYDFVIQHEHEHEHEQQGTGTTVDAMQCYVQALGVFALPVEQLTLGEQQYGITAAAAAADASTELERRLALFCASLRRVSSIPSEHLLRMHEIFQQLEHAT